MVADFPNGALIFGVRGSSRLTTGPRARIGHPARSSRSTRTQGSYLPLDHRAAVHGTRTTSP